MEQYGSTYTGAQIDAAVQKANNAISKIISKTWSQMVSMRNGGTLVPGQWYRITDYVTTTTQAETQSAGHAFDIIVRADSTNVLNENAYAALHGADAYFSNTNINAWQLKYSLINDKSRFAWADATGNGRGVIYYMKDEWGNECPYDFKNIMFKRYKVTNTTSTGSAFGINGYSGLISVYDDVVPDNNNLSVDTSDYKFFYTFDMNANGGADATIGLAPDKSMTVINNTIMSYIDEFGDIDMDLIGSQYLNNIVIICSCPKISNNVIGSDCTDITIRGGYCESNHIDGYSSRITIGKDCKENYLTSCYDVILGMGCSYNELHEVWTASLNSNCRYNKIYGGGTGDFYFEKGCCYNVIREGCSEIVFAKGYTKNVIVESGNRSITLTTASTTSDASPLKNILISLGVNNSGTMKTITHASANNSYKTTYQNSNSTTKNV